jgi:RHS repeat-associated protein
MRIKGKNRRSARTAGADDIRVFWALTAQAALRTVIWNTGNPGSPRQFRRTVEMTSPNGNVTYTLYDDVNHAVFTFSGVTETVDGSGDGILTTTGPISMTRTQVPYTYSYHGGTVAGTYDETMTFSGTVIVSAYTLDLPGFTQGGGATSGFANVLNLIGVGSSGSPQFTVQTLSRTLYNAASQVIESDDYANISNSTYLATAINSPYSGTLNTNYYATTTGYSDRGWQDHTIDPTGTVTDTFYDGLGRVVSTYVGTDDSTTDGHVWNLSNTSSTNNMTEVSSDVYDNGGVGDGDLTQSTQYVDGTSADNRVSQMLYDFRDRMVASKSGAASSLGSETDGVGRPITVSTLDNLGEAIANFTYDGDDIALSDFASGVSTTTSGGHTVATVDASTLRGYSTTSYDDQGRTYQTQNYFVDQSAGYIGGSPLTTATYYDHRGNVMASVDPRGIWTKYAYDGAGRTVTQFTTNGAGGSTWTAAASVTSDLVLAQNETQYDADGNAILNVSKLRMNNDSTSALGALGGPSSTPAARAMYTASYYDAADRDIADVNVGANGGTAYTRPGSVPARSDTVLVNSTAYNAAGWVDTTTDPRGIVNKSIYDSLGRTVINIAAYDPTVSGGAPTNDQNQTTVYSYDPAGHTTLMIAYLPGTIHETEYVYGVTTAQGSTINSNDLLRTIELPDPTTGLASTSADDQISYTYNAAGETLTTTVQTGTIQTIGYNVLGRTISSSLSTPDSSGSPVTTYAYDTLGDMTGMTDPLNHTTNYQYDSLGRQLAVIQPSPDGIAARPTTTYAYDADGNVTSMTDANGNTTTYTYDLLNRQTSMTAPDPDGSGPSVAPVTTYFYNTGTTGNGMQVTDPLGNLTGATPALHTVTTVSDDFGRISQVIQPSPDGIAAQPTTTYTYDRDGNQLSITDPSGNTTSYTYDDLNRQITNTTTYGTQTSIYDASNNLISYTDRDGRTKTYTYDALDRRTQENWLNSSSVVINTINYSYDTTGRMTGTSDSDSSTAYTYDDLNRVTSETLTLAALSSQPVTFTRNYDLANRQTLLSTSVGGTDDLLNHYSYDNINRLTSVQQADMADAITAGWITSPGTYTANTLTQKRSDFGYSALGQYTSISRYAGLSTSSLVASTSDSYDYMNRLTGITHTVNTSGTPTTISYAFTFDANSRITQMVNADGTSNYTYDNNGQLLSNSLSTESYTYDANGNRTSADGTSYGTPNADNQVSNDGTYTYTYDNEGNRITRTSIATGQVDTYTWDFRNRLTDVVTKTSGGTTLQSVHYTYDTLNRRIGETVRNGSGTVTLAENYVYDGSNLLLVLNASSGAVTQRFLNGANANEVLAQETVSTGNTNWALTDQVGSIRDVVDNGTGHAILDHIVYDSFGKVTSQTNSTYAMRMGYTGMVEDADSGLYYDYARYYDPATGEFINQDPLDFAAGDENLYRYVGNKPVDDTDPMGLEANSPATQPDLSIRNAGYPKSKTPKINWGWNYVAYVFFNGATADMTWIQNVDKKEEILDAKSKPVWTTEAKITEFSTLPTTGNSKDGISDTILNNRAKSDWELHNHGIGCKIKETNTFDARVWSLPATITVLDSKGQTRQELYNPNVFWGGNLPGMQIVMTGSTDYYTFRDQLANPPEIDPMTQITLLPQSHPINDRTATITGIKPNGVLLLQYSHTDTLEFNVVNGMPKNYKGSIQWTLPANTPNLTQLTTKKLNYVAHPDGTVSFVVAPSSTTKP